MADYKWRVLDDAINKTAASMANSLRQTRPLGASWTTSANTSTREPRAFTDEPTWEPPTDAETLAAQAQMPSKATGHLTGYRVFELKWRRDGGALLPELGSQTWGYRWPAGRPAAGYDWPRHSNGQDSGSWLALVGTGPPPGLYAYKKRRDALDNLNHLSGGTQVVAEVALWGTVVEHEAGYRARWAYPTRLWLWSGDDLDALEPREIAAALTARYGCPAEAGLPVDDPADRGDTFRVASQELLATPNKSLRDLEVLSYDYASDSYEVRWRPGTGPRATLGTPQPIGTALSGVGQGYPTGFPTFGRQSRWWRLDIDEEEDQSGTVKVTGIRAYPRALTDQELRDLSSIDDEEKDDDV